VKILDFLTNLVAHVFPTRVNDEKPSIEPDSSKPKDERPQDPTEFFLFGPHG
jgi:hypothetical protein